eukprot:scaffold3020_cov342-Prasinococcus_capsulatus_cf.AAC.11
MVGTSSSTCSKGPSMDAFSSGSHCACACCDAATVDVDFHGVNVLRDDALREGIKQYSKWPTIPQVYLNGEFIGGCDILMQMHDNDEVEKVFGGEDEPASPS